MNCDGGALLRHESNVAAYRLSRPRRPRRSALRVLHVISRLDRAGVETWLMHVLRNVDRSEVQMDFLVHGNLAATYDDEARSLGSRIVAGPCFRQQWCYCRRIREILRSAPAYDIVHAHVDFLSGYALKCAAQVGVPVRIAHSHNDLVRSFSKLNWPLKLLSLRGKSLTTRYSTHRLAASKVAGESLYGNNLPQNKWNVLPCGIDPAPYSLPRARQDVRKEFGVDDDTVVIGHVGRMATQKNHRKILEVVSAMVSRQIKCRLVLVGDGSLRKSVEHEVTKRGLKDLVTFAGVRSDIPMLMKSLFDVFLLPSYFEGLGLVLIEAQASGCPAVVSDVVPHEADVVSNLVTRLPLAEDSEKWTDVVLRAAHTRRDETTWKHAYECVVQSPFNIAQSAKSLMSFYRQACDC